MMKTHKTEPGIVGYLAVLLIFLSIAVPPFVQ